MCLHTGTIPSKTLREAARYLSGFRQRSSYCRGYRVKAKIQIEDLMFRVSEVIKRQFAVLQDQPQRAGVEVISGHGRFLEEPHAIDVELTGGGRHKRLTADFILIACGTRPARRDDIPFAASQIYDSDELIQVTEGDLPKSMIVVGGGVIGLEYASMMAALGVEVTVIEAKNSLLPYVDEEITQTLMYHLRRFGLTFRLGEKVVLVEAPPGGVVASLESGKTLTAETLLYAVGRQPNTDRGNLGATGLQTEARGRLKTDADFRTAIPHIFAAGDVVGFPSLASTSMEQGRHAVCSMFRV